MTQQLAGFPYWELTFDEAGNLAPPDQGSTFPDEVGQAALTDLFVFAHGWNNDEHMAHTMYQMFYQLMRTLLDDAGLPKRGSPTIGTVGIIWPARLWADEFNPVTQPGGAASLGAAPSDADLVLDLKPLFPPPAQQAALDEMAQLLAEKSSDPAKVNRFHELMKTIASPPDGAPEDNGEQAGLLDQDPIVVFRKFASIVPASHWAGGAADLGNPFNWIWNGAKQALRLASYWEMKKRAGVIGKQGLGPLLGNLAARGAIRIHLIGHSFGARLASFTLAGLPDAALQPSSTVKSVFLLQGAFSHFAFANALPMHPDEPGALAGMLRHIDGPLVVTHSLHDMAVGVLYPNASIISGDNAADFASLLYEWGAMGHDGAQAVRAGASPVLPVGQPYTFTPAGAFNLDGNTIITQGGPPSGAHGDIFHPELAWAALTAAAIV